MRLLRSDAAGIDASAVVRGAAESSRTALTDAVGRVWAYEYSAGGRCCLDVPGTATFAAADDSGVIVVVPAPRATGGAIQETVARGVAAVFAHRSGLEVLHASAVSFDGVVVAFCGAPNSGKSTLGYAFARRSYTQWSDDVLAIDADTRPPLAVPLPFAPRLRDPSASFLSAAKAVSAAPEEPLPLGTVFLLERVPDEELRVEPVTGAEAFTSTLGSSLFLEDAQGERRDLTIRHFLALAAGVQLFRLTYPSDLRELDRVLDAVESVVAGKASA